MTLLDAPAPAPVLGAPTVTSPAPADAWWSCYRLDATAVPSQSPAWTAAMVATGDWRDASRHYRFEDGREVVLPLVQRRGLGPSRLASMPDAWGYGGIVGTTVDPAVVEAVMADLGSIGAAWIRLRPSPLHAEAWAQVDHGGRGTLHRIARRAHVLPLGADSDEVFRTRFTSKCRWSVRSAERSGLEVEEDATGRLLPVFHGLLMCSVERWAGSQHEPLALARWRADRRDPLDKLMAWSEALGGTCRTLVARRDGVALAAMIVLQDHNAHMTRSAMDRELVGKDRPNELLMWHAVRAAADAGCGSYHMGESGRSDSLSHYKEKFGAQPMDYAELRLERLPVTRVDGALRAGVKRIVGFREP